MLSAFLKFLLLVCTIGFFQFSIAFAEGFSVERLKCPFGAQEMGDAPPDGNFIYCAKVIPGKSQPMRHGLFTSWYRTGELRKTGEYHYGKLEGEQKEFYQNGQLKEKLVYVKGGTLDGEHIAYYPDGSVEIKEIYKNGKLNGSKEQNYRNGHARSTSTYKDGTIEGIFVLFHQNGQPRVKGFYHNKARSGTWTTFYEDGTKRLVGEFTEGKADGTWTRYSRKGNPLSVTKFEMGTLTDRQRYKRQPEEAKKKASNIDERDKKRFAEWNGKVKRSIRDQQKADKANEKYIPRDEKRRLAMERRKEYQQNRLAKKRAAKDRELDAVLDNQKNPFYGMFAVGKKKH